jgi:hypothetical protein
MSNFCNSESCYICDQLGVKESYDIRMQVAESTLEMLRENKTSKLTKTKIDEVNRGIVTAFQSDKLLQYDKINILTETLNIYAAMIDDLNTLR